MIGLKRTVEKKSEDGRMKCRMEDLKLLNSINMAVNRGDSLSKIIKLINTRTKKIFSGSGATVFLIDDGGKYLIMQNINLSTNKRRVIEGLIKVKIPEVRIPLAGTGCYYKILKGKKPVIINNVSEIKGLIRELTDSISDKQKILKAAARRLLPEFYRLLGIKSVIAVPLISNGSVLGLLDISARKPFKEFDLKRICALSEQVAIVIDRKKIENKLRFSYKELEQVFETSTDGIVFINKDFIITKSNKMFNNLAGLGKNEIIEKKCFEVFPRHECNTPKCILKRIISGEKYIKSGLEKKRIDGMKIRCTLTADSIKDINGKIIGAVGIFKDITLQDKAFRKIGESEKKFKELFEHMRNGVAVYEAVDGGKDFIIRDYNKAAERIDKVKRKNIIGKSVLEVFPGIKDIGLFDVFKRVNRTGMFEKHPLCFYKDKRLSGWRRNYVYKLPSGEIVTIYDDLTRQKQVEESLKTSEELSSSLMNNSPTPIVVVNPDTSVRYVNPAMEKLVGLKPGEALGVKVPYPWWPKNQVDNYSKHYKESLLKNVKNKEILFCNKDKKDIWVQLSRKPVFSKGKLKYLISNWVNISGQKSAEDKLKIGYKKLKRILDGTINTLSAIVEAKDPYTSGHQKRVSKLAVAVAKELDLEKERVEAIRVAALIHDIGKINIPASILVKPGRLSDIEYDMIKTHPEMSYDMIDKIEFPFNISKIILQHHEKLNGSGYPQGLKSKDILFESKILTVADVVEAMSSDRPYRPALGLDAAIEEIKNNKGKLYDSSVVDACIKVVSKKDFKF